MDTHPLPHKPMRWRVFFVLWIAAIVGLLLILPYALAMIPANLSPKLPPLYILIPLQAAQGAIFLGLLILAGLFFANRTGLGAPVLEAWLDGQDICSKLRSRLLPSVPVGVVVNLAILGLEIL